MFVGIVLILFPKRSKTLYANLIKPVKALFMLPLSFGLLFFWASPASRLEAFIKVLGIIALIKGISILVCPVNVLKSTLQYFLARSERCWRLYGVFMVLLGVVTWWSVL